MTNTPIIRLTARRRSRHAVVHVHRVGRPERRYCVSLARYRQLRQRALEWICIRGAHASGSFYRGDFAVSVWQVGEQTNIELQATDALQLPVNELGFTHQAPLLGEPAADRDPLRQVQIRAIVESGQRFAARIAGLLQARHEARETGCRAASPAHLPVPPESADADRSDP